MPVTGSPFARRMKKKQPGFTRGPRIADLMTAEYQSFFESSMSAERCGDAATALEYHRGIPMFTRGQHDGILTQLASLADEMTPWLWARWAAYQCTRAEDPGTESFFITHAALDYTMQMFYGDRMQAAYDEGRDPIADGRVVVGESWVFHQVCTFELGGLREFLDFLADGRSGGEHRMGEVLGGAAMRGLRLEPTSETGLVMTDLRSRRRSRCWTSAPARGASLGATSSDGSSPSGTTPDQMFDTTPIVVDRQTAEEVAASNRGGWITALTRAIDDGRLELSALESEDRELASDVPGLSLLEAGTRPVDLARTMQQLRDGRDEMGRAAFRILRAAAEGTFGAVERAPYVAAAVLNPHAYDEARRELVASSHRAGWVRWAERVPEPARGRLRRLAEQSAAAAA